MVKIQREHWISSMEITPGYAKDVSTILRTRKDWRMYVSRLNEHPVQNICRAIEEDEMLTYRTICEVIFEDIFGFLSKNILCLQFRLKQAVILAVFFVICFTLVLAWFQISAWSLRCSSTFYNTLWNSTDEMPPSCIAC